MKQTLEILIKLKLMLTSYTELFNGSITENIMRSFWCPQKKNPAQTFPYNIYAVLCGKIFIHFITVSTIHKTRQNKFMRNPMYPPLFAYFAQCRIN